MSTIPKGAIDDMKTNVEKTDVLRKLESVCFFLMNFLSKFLCSLLLCVDTWNDGLFPARGLVLVGRSWPEIFLRLTGVGWVEELISPERGMERRSQHAYPSYRLDYWSRMPTMSLRNHFYPHLLCLGLGAVLKFHNTRANMISEIYLFSRVSLRTMLSSWETPWSHSHSYAFAPGSCPVQPQSDLPTGAVGAEGPRLRASRVKIYLAGPGDWTGNPPITSLHI